MGKSNDAILVLNAGSSSMKLAVFAERGGELSLELRGAVDGLYTKPCFEAHDPTGRVVAEKSWGRTALGHDGAIEYLSDFLRRHLVDPEGRPRLQALVGGDVRYGGLYDLVGVSRDYDADRLIARFAVVHRERMVAW